MSDNTHITVNHSWSEVKHAFLAAKSSGRWASQAPLDVHAGEWHRTPDHGSKPGSWEGGSANQTEEWLKNGYFADEFVHTIGQEHNIAQTSIVWNEDEGDADITRILCGYDDIFLGAVQAPSLSGIKVMVDYCFNCNVSAKVIREYGAFCASLLNSLMEGGFDVEVDVRNSCSGLFRSDAATVDTLIRVKEFGEILDFTDFSALFGPTGMRHLVFCALAMSADKCDKKAASGLGRGIGADWSVQWDEINRVVHIGCASSKDSFPGAYMQRAAIEAGIM